MSVPFKNICAMFHAIEYYHDFQTREHENRTGRLMFTLGKAFGLEHSFCELLAELGSIHDIGKIAIPEAILEKPGPLTQHERNVVELHTLIGEEFIKTIEHPHTALASSIIVTHHENHDGSGYPKGLKGDEIPIEGSICAICDVYDALRETRPYRQRRTHQDAFDMMYDTSANGLYHKFNPQLMKIFKEISSDIQLIYEDSN